MNKVRIAVLCSGGGTNLQAILDRQTEGKIPNGEVVLVICDSESAYALERAKKHRVQTAVFDKKQYPREVREEKILKCLKEHDIELVVLAGFMTILSEKFVKAFENRIINIHPALLPSFGGVGMYGLHVHEAVLESGVKVTGATVHFVTAECDRGPIIEQKAVRVAKNDTPEVLQKRVMKNAEWVIYPRAVQTVCKKLTEEKL